MKRLLPALIVSLVPVALIAQPAAPKRLVAQAWYHGIRGTPYASLADSSYYVYLDSSRVSRFNYTLLYYQERPADFMTMQVPTNNIDSQEYVLLPFDSSMYYDPSPYAPYVEKRTYDPGGALLTVSTKWRRTIYVYSNGLLSRAYFGDGRDPLDTSRIRHLSYDSLGRVVLDSTSVRSVNGFEPFMCHTYTYSGAGRGCSTMHVEEFRPLRTPYYRLTYTYYPDGKVRTRVYDMPRMPGDTFSLYSVDSFGYTPGVGAHTYWLQSFPQTNEVYQIEAKRFNAFGQPDSVIAGRLQPGKLELIWGWATRNDADGDPVIRYSYRGDSSGTSLYTGPSEVDYYYYSTEAPAGTGIVRQARTTILLYPNPAGNTIHLRSSGIPAGTPVSVLITAMNGQAVHEERFVWIQGAQRIVLGDEAPPGMYQLQVRGAGSVVLGCEMFIRK